MNLVNINQLSVFTECSIHEPHTNDTIRKKKKGPTNLCKGLEHILKSKYAEGRVTFGWWIQKVFLFNFIRLNAQDAIEFRTGGLIQFAVKFNDPRKWKYLYVEKTLKSANLFIK